MLRDKLRSFSRFPRVFWVAQTFEMMERGAYYSMMPIIVIHAIYNVGLNPYIGGMIAAFMYPFQYGLPIFTGALAEKVGYRRQIIFAFSVLTIAYFFLFMAFDTITMIFAVIAVGIGIGSYKPLISATVAKSTTSEDRNLAYSIYYWIVNLAAFLFPLFFVIAELTGNLPESSYYYVFLIGGIMVSVNIVTAVFKFEEVPRSGKVKTVGDAVKNIKIAFQDRKFVVMVVLIGGFWGLYATMLFAIQIIGYGYRWLPAFLTAMALGIPNPMTIILLGPFISKYIKKVESMRVVLGGLLVYLVGLIILGYSLQQWEFIIVGIVIASVGEFMVAPGYLAFISKLAPKENISAYIGCNFISYMIGLFGGTIVFSTIVNYVGVDLRMPYFCYGIIISFGLFLLFAFILYYQTWGQDVIKRAQAIREIEEGVNAEKPSLVQNEPFIFRFFETKVTGIIALILIPVVLFSSFSMGTYNYIGPEGEEEGIPAFKIENFNIGPGPSDDSSGNLNEGASTTETVDIELAEGQLMRSMTFELVWQDEEDYTRLLRTWENQGDQFTLSVNQGSNFTASESETNAHGSAGTITIEFDFDHANIESTNGTGEWNIEITLVTCGDLTNQFSPILYTDTSNSYELHVTTEIYVPLE